jgi:outer membrane protein insertion porin family
MTPARTILSNHKPSLIDLHAIIALVHFFVLTCFPLLIDSPGLAQSAQPNIRVIESILLQGNKKTEQEVITRRLTIQEGDTIDASHLAELLDQNRRILTRTNFFKEVDLYPQPGTARGNIVVVVEIKERKWPFFQFEGGHNDLNGWFFVPASVHFDNLFGHGSEIAWRLYWSDDMNRSSLTFRTYKLFKYKAFLDADILLDVDQTFVHYLNNQQVSQQVKYGGLELKIGGANGIWRHLFAGFKSIEYKPENFATIANLDSNITSDQLPESIQDDLPGRRIRTFSAGIYADKRDNPDFPMHGYWGAITAESGASKKSGDISFQKVTFDARWFRRVSDRQVVALHLKGGFASEETPFYNRFYLGGANSLRGFASRRLTPQGWGTKLLLSNAELRFPLSGESFPNHKATGIVFFDVGGIWLPEETLSFEDLSSSFGIGFRVRLPVVGLTRFDLSFPLRSIDQNDFKVHISLGHTF